jgi:hypothetical protein
LRDDTHAYSIGVMTHAEMLKELQRLKGSGAWEDIAKLCGIDYFTVSRIARQDIKNPGVLTVEKIAAAMAKLKTEPRAA